MSSKPVSTLEERLAGRLAAWLLPHAMLVEPVPGGPVLDGLEAPVAARPLEAPVADAVDAVDAGATDAAEDDEVPAPGADDVDPRQSPDAADPAAGPTGERRHLLPEACLEGVTDAEALGWAAVGPGPELVTAVEQLWATVAPDVGGACRPVDTPPTSSAVGPGRADADADADGAGDGDARAGLGVEVPVPGAPPGGVSDAVLLEAVAACERQLAALTARRDALAGVFAARRQAEAEQDVADARAATAADGLGRPWATRARSSGPSELGARLGIGTSAAEAMAERGLAALGPQREVAQAMAAGALPAAAGSWLLEELTAVRATAFAGTLERVTAGREAALAAQRAQEDAALAAAGAPPLTSAERRARATADRAQVDEQAQAAAAEHAEQVAAQVRRELLGRATGSSSWPSDIETDLDAGTDSNPSSDGGSGEDPVAPTSRPTAGAGLGASKRTWKRRLSLAVRRADAAAAEVRAAKARSACSTRRWNEDDDQAALLLRAPADVIARITAAMDARARRRQSDARAAERAAATEAGRRFDGSAVGTLDQHRIAALEEWAIAAVEISDTSGISGTWYPIARTAASKPSVSLVLPWTVLAGVSTIGAVLAGYGPLGAAAALRIAADGMWRRVFADPRTGAVVGVEERTWRPSTSLAQLVSLRWPGSTLPGSTRPVGLGSGAGVTDGQLDHVDPYACDADGRSCGGPTEATNLQLLAQVEHLLKQAGEHARPGHGWSVAVDRTGPPGPGGSPPEPSPGDGVVWTSPTGHTYRASPQEVLGPDPDVDAHLDGGLQPWVHRLLADVLPAWVGWPADGPTPFDGEPAAWSNDWASAAFADIPPDPAPGSAFGDLEDDEPCLFDDLPLAG